jgi:D-glycero-alpha-D-manno-heptose-7-phosphate kinase
VDIEKSKIANIGSRKAELRRIGEMVEEAIAILSSSSTSLREFGRLLDDGWRCKRSLSDKVSTPQIDQMYEAARSAGALGGKLLGAGGGGFLLLYVPLELQAQVAQALSRLVHVPFEFERGGSRVVLYQPDGL